MKTTLLAVAFAATLAIGADLANAQGYGGPGYGGPGYGGYGAPPPGYGGPGYGAPPPGYGYGRPRYREGGRCGAYLTTQSTTYDFNPHRTRADAIARWEQFATINNGPGFGQWYRGRNTSVQCNREGPVMRCIAGGIPCL